jgi:hypothetical protein
LHRDFKVERKSTENLFTAGTQSYTEEEAIKKDWVFTLYLCVLRGEKVLYFSHLTACAAAIDPAAAAITSTYFNPEPVLNSTTMSVGLS